MVNNTVYHFDGSKLGAEIFLKKSEHHKKGALKWRIEVTLYTLYWGFEKIRCKVCLLLYSFLVIKTILKALFSLIPWLLNSSDLPSFDSNSRKRYTVRLLSICQGRSTTSIRGKVFPFDSLVLLLAYLYTYFLSKTLKMAQNYTKTDS